MIGPAELALISDHPLSKGVSPAADRRSTLPGSAWPSCPPLAEIYRAARDAFPGLSIGGGVLSYFTELTRKRPTVDLLDFVSHCTVSGKYPNEVRGIAVARSKPWKGSSHIRRNYRKAGGEITLGSGGHAAGRVGGARPAPDPSSFWTGRSARLRPSSPRRYDDALRSLGVQHHYGRDGIQRLCG